MMCSYIFDLCFFVLARLTVEAAALHNVRVRARTRRDERTSL
jgi:cob(I)alamin adenosyltransferase